MDPSAAWRAALLLCIFAIRRHCAADLELGEMRTLQELKEHLQVEAIDEVWPPAMDSSNPCERWRGVLCEGDHVVSLSLAPLAQAQKQQQKHRHRHSHLLLHHHHHHQHRLHQHHHQEGGAGDDNRTLVFDLVVADLAKLPYLRSFSASGFAFHGPIPAEIGDLHSLEALDLASASLHGSIPASFARLLRLQILSLASNNLSGHVSSASMEPLCSLQHLNLSFNSFTGSLPETLISCASQQLSSLDFSHNSFHGSFLPQGNLELLHLQHLDISHNSLSGDLPPSAFSSLRSISFLNLQHNAFSGSIPSSLSRCSSLEILLLDHNRLDGGIPAELSDLRNLAILSLSFNNLTGTLPPQILAMPNLTTAALSHNLFFGSLPRSSSCDPRSKLRTFDVSYNFLLGDLPPCFNHSSEGVARNCFANAPEQHDTESCSLFYARNKLSWHDLLPESIVPTNIDISLRRRDRGRRKIRTKEELMIALGCVTVGSCILALAGGYMLFLQRLKHDPDELEVVPRTTTIETEAEKFSSSASWPGNRTFLGKPFSFDDLRRATNGFDRSYIIAYGQSGSFYKGMLDDGATVVVKRIYTSKMLELYRNEVEVLRKASDARLISLLGHCVEATSNCEKFLVYPYMPFGDLASTLQTKGLGSGKMRKCNPKIVLDWITRLKIAIGVAEGLVFLHHACSPPIAHRDVKAHSILLDDMFEVRIGGLSSASSGNKEPHPRLISCLMGISQSLDQADRESGATGCSKDVYDFGKLLLGIISGKCGITDKHDSQTDSWVELAISLVNVNEKMAMYQLLDPCMVVEGDFLEEVLATALIAKACLNCKASKRPSMQLVLKALENPRLVFEDRSLCKSTPFSSPHYRNLFGSTRLTNDSPGSSTMGSARGHHRMGKCIRTIKKGLLDHNAAIVTVVNMFEKSTGSFLGYVCIMLLQKALGIRALLHLSDWFLRPLYAKVRSFLLVFAIAFHVSLLRLCVSSCPPTCDTLASPSFMLLQETLREKQA